MLGGWSVCVVVALLCIVLVGTGCAGFVFLRPFLVAFCFDPSGGPAVWPASALPLSSSLSRLQISFAVVLLFVP